MLFFMSIKCIIYSQNITSKIFSALDLKLYIYKQTQTNNAKTATRTSMV